MILVFPSAEMLFCCGGCFFLRCPVPFPLEEARRSSVKKPFMRNKPPRTGKCCVTAVTRWALSTVCLVVTSALSTPTVGAGLLSRAQLLVKLNQHLQFVSGVEQSVCLHRLCYVAS